MLHSQGTNHFVRQTSLFALLLLLLAACSSPSQNTAPTASAGQDQTVTVGTEVTLNGSLSSDPDEGDTLDYSWTFKAQPEGSSATLSGADNVAASFTPDVVGEYVVELTVSDGEEEATDTVTIIAEAAPEENSPPTATADGYEVAPGATLTVEAPGILDNDADPDEGDTLVVSEVNGEAANVGTELTLESGSTLTVNANGSFSFVHNAASAAATETFTYRVSDGEAESNEATVTITITADPNNQPVAAISVDPDTSVTTGTTVTLNGSDSTDPDGDSLTYSWSLTTVPTGSAATFSSTDTVETSFTPDVVGEYVIELTVSDGEKEATDTVTITAEAAPAENTPPTAEDDSYELASGATFNVEAPGILDNDTDPDEGDTLVVSEVNGEAANVGTELTLESGSTLTVNANGSLTFVHNAASTAETETFTYTANDGEATSNEATVTLTITPEPNNPPIADAGENQTVTVGETVTLDGSGSDPDGDDLTYSWNFTSVPAGSSATLSGADSAAPSFTPDVVGEYVVELTVSDGEKEATDTVTITAEAAPAENTPPTADAAGLERPGNTAISGDLNDYVNDVDGDPLTFSIDTTNTQGDVTLDESTGEFSYTPPVGMTDISDSFDYTVSDGNATASATVTVTIDSQLVWYVGTSAGAGDGRSSSPFNNLQTAEDASGPGDIIYIFSTLEGSTYSNDGFTLQANQQLLGQGVPLEIVAGEILFEATAKPILTSEGAAPGTTAIQMAAGSTIAGLSVANSTGDGIRVFDADGATIRDVEVIDSQTNGINIYESPALPAMAVTLTGVSVEGAGENGIEVSGYDGNEVGGLKTALTATMTDIVITDTGFDGIHSIDPVEFSLENATITNAGRSWGLTGDRYYGIWLDDGIGGNYTFDGVFIDMVETSAVGKTAFAGIGLFANDLFGLGAIDFSLNGADIKLAVTATGGGTTNSRGLEIRFATTAGGEPSDPQVNLSGTGNTASAAIVFRAEYEATDPEAGNRITGQVEINSILYPTAASPSYWIPDFSDPRYNPRF